MKKHLQKLAILNAILVPTFAIAPAYAQATRTWVSGVGDDANPCSRTAPCKTFAGAISKTAAGGEINCLDPGGWGAVTITKSIKIDCLQFTGGILSAGTTAINISSTANMKVILRGLEITGAGTGVHGVSVNVPAEVTLDKMHISGITGNGVNVATTTAGTSNVIVIDTVITQANKGIAFSATGGGAAIGHIRNVNIYKVTAGAVSLDTGNTFATVSHSMLTGNGTGGLAAASGTVLGVADSTLTYNTTGLNASASGAIVKMTNSDILNNGTSTAFVAGATLSSSGDNRVDPAGPAPNGTVTKQ